jgi:predicted Zn-dependent protease
MWGAAMALAAAAGASLGAFAEPAGRSPETTVASVRLAGPYLAAQTAQAAGDWAAAADYTTRALAADPDETRLLRQAMVLTLASGDLEAASLLAPSLGPDATERVLLPLVDAARAVESADWQAAQERLESLSDRGFQRGLRRALLAVVAAERDDAAEARAHLEALAGPEGDAALAWARFIDLALAIGETQAAEAAAARFAAADPGQGLMLAVVRRLRGADRFAAAEALARDGLARYGEGALFAEEAALAAAGVALYKPAPDARRAFADALLDLARQADRRGSPAMTLVLAHLAQRLAPQEASAALIIGAVAERFGRAAEAERAYAAVPSGDALFLQAALRRAIVREAAGDRSEALAQLEKLAARFPDSIAPLAALGEMRRTGGDERGALSAFETAADRMEALGLKPSRQLHFALALSRYETDGWERAAVPLAAALAVQPEDAQARALAALVTLRAGDAEGASSHAFAALDVAPDSPAALRAYAEVMLARGKAAEAVEALEAAAAAAPTAPEINEALGDAYWQAGRRREAAFQWQRASLDQRDGERLAKLARKLQFGLDLRADAPVAPNEVRAAGP